MKIGQTRINQDRARAGDWIEVEVVNPETKIGETKKFKVACLDPAINVNYQTTVLKSGKKFRAVSQAFGDKIEEMPEKVRIEMTDTSIRNFAESVLLDWEGFEGDDGKPLKYTSDVGYLFLKEFPEVYYALKDRAEDLDRFREKVREADAGN